MYRDVRLSPLSWLLEVPSPRRSRRAAWRLDMLGDDEQLAMHVTHVHMHNTHPALDFEVLDPTLIR